MEAFTKDEAMLLLSCAEIPIINDFVNYWFIRTSGGDNFENFYFGNYVAIGWDEFDDLNMLKEVSHDTLKNQIENIYPEDTKPGSAASQIQRFVNEVKIGDYILIPGTNCDRIAFGVITSDVFLYEPTEQDKLDAIFDGIEPAFLKRRNVAWFADGPFTRNELDPLLLPIIYSYGTIVNANPYSDFINRTLYNSYYRDGQLHSIFNVTKRKNIQAYDLCSFINTIFESLDIYSKLMDCEVDHKELSIKASINSPGPIEIITAATSIFIVLSSISLLLNGAKVKFSFNIFNIASGEVNIDSPGLLEKNTKATTE